MGKKNEPGGRSRAVYCQPDEQDTFFAALRQKDRENKIKKCILYSLVQFSALPKEQDELFFQAESREELRKRDTVGLGGFADGLAAGDRAPDTAHAELEECFGCFGLCLEELVDSAVSSDLSHSIT